MRASAIGVLLVVLSFPVIAQVEITTDNPDAGAALEIKSTTGGFLLPRMTTSQIFYINAPEAGLTVFNKDSLDLWFFDGIRWRGVHDPSDTLNPSAGYCGIDLLYEGQYYMTVKIGTQCWMAENLNVGTMINGDQEQTQQIPDTIQKYCYNNSEDSCAIYGGLYQWKEMMQYSTTPGVQGICPENWHIPTDSEWTTLFSYLGGWEIAGGKMKEEGSIHWQSPNTGATNESGFTALPGGLRNPAGSFISIRAYAWFWTSTTATALKAYNHWLYHDLTSIISGNQDKVNGFSVRCVKD
jgi:uncharacterized protein (TIGR02145 family)